MSVSPVASPVVRPLEDVERVFGENPCIAEFAVIPIEGRPGRFVAVIVPNGAEMRKRNVMLLWSRFVEDLEKPNCRFDMRVDFDEIVFLDAALPRTPAGAIDRPALAARVAAHKEAKASALSKADDALLAEPAARRFLDRLPSLFQPRTPLHPAYELERDVGMDSLDLVHVRALLEQEFGVALGDHEAWEHVTVGDVLRRVVAANAPVQLAPREHDWAVRLEEPPKETLEQRYPATLWNRFIAAFGRKVFHVYSWWRHDLEIVGREKLPKSGAYMVCPTHQSLIDGPLMWAHLYAGREREALTVAFGEFFREGFGAKVVQPGRLVLTGEADSVADSLRVMYGALKKGGIVGIFPEGDRSWRGQIHRPRPGTGIVACEAQVPIVPVIFQGSRVLLSHEHAGLAPGRIRIVIGDPIPPPPKKKFTKADYRAHMDKWYAAVTKLEEEWGGRDPK